MKDFVCLPGIGGRLYLRLAVYSLLTLTEKYFRSYLRFTQSDCSGIAPFSIASILPGKQGINLLSYWPTFPQIVLLLRCTYRTCCLAAMCTTPYQ